MAGPAVYLDNNATTAVSPAARAAMLPFLGEECGNPSSMHGAGMRAKAAVARARALVAALAGAASSEVVFTSGGTEADHLAILGALEAAGEAKRHVVSTTVEHPAVRDLLRALRQRGRIGLTEVPVGGDGTLDADRVLAAIREDTALVAAMWANNETGVLHPVAELAAGCRGKSVPFFTDAVQAAGKVAVDLGAVGASLLTLSAHKIHGPKGVGALIVRRGARWLPWPVQAHHEGGRRSGTENVPGIAGFGAAAEEAKRLLPEEERVAALRDRLEERVLAAVPGARRSTGSAPREPNTANLLFPGAEGESLVLRLDAAGIAVSTGSACTTGSAEPSPVLLAMGIPKRDARGALRISLSRFTTEEEVDRAAAAVVAAARGPGIRRPGDP
jgi:cysteine desulfurase